MARLSDATHTGAYEIYNAVYGLKRDLQVEREESRASFHRCLVEALHYPGLWKKAKWR